MLVFEKRGHVQVRLRAVAAAILQEVTPITSSARSAESCRCPRLRRRPQAIANPRACRARVVQYGQGATRRK
jgi:hypothetical protein